MELHRWKCPLKVATQPLLGCSHDGIGNKLCSCSVFHSFPLLLPFPSTSFSPPPPPSASFPFSFFLNLLLALVKFVGAPTDIHVYKHQELVRFVGVHCSTLRVFLWGGFCSGPVEIASGALGIATYVMFTCFYTSLWRRAWFSMIKHCWPKSKPNEFSAQDSQKFYIDFFGLYSPAWPQAFPTFFSPL